MNKDTHLSKRLKAVVDMVSPGKGVCDVGCDHGYVSIELVKSNKAPFALAMDINEGPLMRAKEHIEEFGLHNKIKTRLSNGLEKYRPGEAKSLIIAGMGGPLIKDILSFNEEYTNDFDEYILSPQSCVDEFRSFLSDNNFRIIDEEMIFEDDKYYVIEKCVKSGDKQVMSTKELLFGPVLLKKKHPILLQFLQKEEKKVHDILCKLDTQTQTSDIIKRREDILIKEAVSKDCLACFLRD